MQHSARRPALEHDLRFEGMAEALQERRFVFTAIEEAENAGAAFEHVAARIDALLREQRGEDRALVGEAAVDRLCFAAFERHLPCPRALHQRKTERAVHALRREAQDAT